MSTESRADSAAAEPAATVPPSGAWIVCLCAEWCGACREYRPLIARLEATRSDWRFAWVDIEDHADLADAFDVETFPTLLLVDAQGIRFHGPLLPHAETLVRLLGALPAPRPTTREVARLLSAIESEPDAFALG